MTTMRVTVGSIAYSGLSAIRTTSSTLARLQDELSSGKQIRQPSDDPVGTVRALGLRSQMARNDQYGANADDALGWLSQADTTYAQITDVLQNAQTTVLRGLNAGANDPTANEALAQQVDKARAALLALSNTAYNGRPLFGGTTAGGAAYDASGTYVGDAGAVSRVVGDNNTVTVSANGPAVFGSGKTDVFAALSNIATALRTNPSALSGSLATLSGALSTVSAARSAEGAAYEQVQQAQTTQITADTAMKTQLSGIEDVDLAEMAIKVTTANTAYQAALQTTATVRQLSLLDFLR